METQLIPAAFLSLILYDDLKREHAALYDSRKKTIVQGGVFLRYGNANGTTFVSGIPLGAAWAVGMIYKTLGIGVATYE